MFRSLVALLISPFVIASAVAQQLPPGTYKVLSLTMEVEGSAPKDMLGKELRGFAIFTPTRVAFLITGESRKFGPSVEERAKLWDTLAAYSGTYQVDGDKFVITVDVSANEIWNGTKRVRHWRLDGKTLAITTERAPYSRDPSKMVVVRLVAERVE
jgi:hypothetical protein